MKDNAVNAADPTGWEDVEEYKVGTIDKFNVLTRASKVGDGIENHHLLPKSIACIFEVTAGTMIAIALLPGPHQAYDNAWNNWFREIGAQGTKMQQRNCHDYEGIKCCRRHL